MKLNLSPMKILGDNCYRKQELRMSRAGRQPDSSTWQLMWSTRLGRRLEHVVVVGGTTGGIKNGIMMRLRAASPMMRPGDQVQNLYLRWHYQNSNFPRS